MPKKEELLQKLLSKPMPSNFTTRDLDALMKRCGCSKFSGGRGAGIGYLHELSNRTGLILEMNSIDIRLKLSSSF